MLEIRDLQKRYDSLEVLNIKNLVLPKKGLFLLRGDNGEGKTTLLNIISKNDQKYNGCVLYNGINIKKIKGSYRKTIIKYIEQDVYFLENKSVYENLTFLNPIPKEKCIDILKKVNLNNLIDNKVETLSDGERKRLSLAIVLSSDYEILLLDEITNNLDIENAKELIKILGDISQEKLVLFSTHEAIELFDKINFYEININKSYNFKNNESIDYSTKFKLQKRQNNLTIFLKNNRVLQCLFSFFLIIFSVLLSLNVAFFSINQNEKYNDLLKDYVQDNYLIMSYINGENEYYKNEYTDLIYDTYIETGGINFSFNSFSEEIKLYNLFYSTFTNKNINVNITYGILPTSSKEIIISDIFANKLLENYKISSYEQLLSYHPPIDFNIVGIYQSSEKIIGISENLSNFYQNSENIEKNDYFLLKNKYLSFMRYNAFSYFDDQVLHKFQNATAYYNFINDIDNSKLECFYVEEKIQSTTEYGIGDPIKELYNRMIEVSNTLIIALPFSLFILIVLYSIIFTYKNLPIIKFLKSYRCAKKDAVYYFIGYSLLHLLNTILISLLLTPALIALFNNLISILYVSSNVLSFFKFNFNILLIIPFALIIQQLLTYLYIRLQKKL